MSKENSTPLEEEIIENDGNSTPRKEEGSGEASEKTGETSETSLFERLSQETGKTIKDEATLVKMLQQQAKDFSVAGQKKPDSTPQPQINHNDRLAEEILKNRNANLQHVMDDVKTIAQAQGKDIFTVVDENPWLAEKAKAIAEVKEKEAKAKDKISFPSHQIEGDIDFKNITPEQIKTMSNKDYAKYQDYLRKQSTTPGKITL